MALNLNAIRAAEPEVESFDADGPTIVEKDPVAEVEHAGTPEVNPYLAALPDDLSAPPAVSVDAHSEGNAEAHAAPEEPEAPAVDPEEEAKTEEERLIEEHMKANGVSREQAVAAYSAMKAKLGAPVQRAAVQDQPSEQQPQRQQQGGGRGSALGSALGGIGSVFGGGGRLLGKGGKAGLNAALRGTGINRSAGITPDSVRKGLARQWHHEYETGVGEMSRSIDDLKKMAAAYNQTVRMSAPGKELEKIAKKNGKSLDTFMSELTAGTVDDADAKTQMEALRQNPAVQSAWAKVDESSEKYGKSWGKIQSSLPQLANNFPEKIDVEAEALRLQKIRDRHDTVERPLEVPANPIDGPKPGDGQSKMKAMWEQFQEIGASSLSFIQNLIDRVSSFVASKFGPK